MIGILGKTKNIRLKIADRLSNNERSRNILKNILLSFGVKGGSIIVNFMLVPMTISYINPIEYGIWLTISSIVSWMTFFDIGLGNGLRNKVAIEIANERWHEAKVYVSTAYAVLTIISSGLFVFFFTVNHFVNWRSFLNVPENTAVDLQLIFLVVFASFSVQFVVQTINTILIATHQSAKAGLNTFLGQLGILIAVFFLKRIFPGSLNILVWALTSVPILVLSIVSIYMYNSKLKYLAPSFKSINFKYTKSIMNLGGAFFVIQMGAIVLFQSDNIIITKVIGPLSVTSFNIAYKLFAIITMVFTIVMTPYWTAFTDAYAKKDFDWMRANVKSLRKYWLVISILITPAVIFFSPQIYVLWIGKAVSIPFGLSLMMGIYSMGYSCLSLNCFFLNGVGKIKLQFYLYIFSALINIPLGIYLAKIYGNTGVVLSNVIIFLVMNVFLWIQTDKILEQSNSKFWSK